MEKSRRPRKMDRKDRTVCTWLGQSFLNTYDTMRSKAVVARSGRPHSVAREPLQDATMRSGRPTHANAGGHDEVGRTADPPNS